jgi:hypothetical protein
MRDSLGTQLGATHHGNDLGMNTLDELENLPPRRAAKIRQAAILSRKLNLLLDTIKTETGETYDHPSVSAAAMEKCGYFISRTRWTLLKAGREQAIPRDLLIAIATVFDVDPEYLLQEDGPLPEQVEAELKLLLDMRRAEVRTFAARALGDLDPEALSAISKILEDNA